MPVTRVWTSDSDDDARAFAARRGEACDDDGQRGLDHIMRHIRTRNITSALPRAWIASSYCVHIMMIYYGVI